ncbi:hypothetical protein ILUMI_13102, partial [Ignelater luminosus]
MVVPVQRMPENRLTKRVILARAHGTNRRIRPRRTWQEEVEKEVAKETGIRWEEIRVLAQNKKEWKKKITRLPSLTPSLEGLRIKTAETPNDTNKYNLDQDEIQTPWAVSALLSISREAQV